MAWDSSRPVPWERLVREWLIYVAIMAAIFLLFFRDGGLYAVFVGLLVSGPLYLGVGYVLAKFGYQRKSFKELRQESRAAAEPPTSSGSSTSSDATASRPRPAPTRRTAGSTQHRPKPRRKR